MNNTNNNKINENNINSSNHFVNNKNKNTNTNNNRSNNDDVYSNHFARNSESFEYESLVRPKHPPSQLFSASGRVIEGGKSAMRSFEMIRMGDGNMRERMEVEETSTKNIYNDLNVTNDISKSANNNSDTTNHQSKDLIYSNTSTNYNHHIPTHRHNSTTSHTSAHPHNPTLHHHITSHHRLSSMRKLECFASSRNDGTKKISMNQSREERRKSRRATEKYRSAHASRERIRVEAFNLAFNRLRKLLPTLPPDKKLSKIEILRLAICYISYLNHVLQIS